MLRSDRSLAGDANVFFPPWRDGDNRSNRRRHLRSGCWNAMMAGTLLILQKCSGTVCLKQRSAWGLHHLLSKNETSAMHHAQEERCRPVA